MKIQYSFISLGLLILISVSTLWAFEESSTPYPAPQENTRRKTTLREMWKQSTELSAKNHTTVSSPSPISQHTLDEVSEELPISTSEIETDASSSMSHSSKSSSKQTPSSPTSQNQPQVQTQPSSQSHTAAASSKPAEATTVIPVPVFIMAEPMPSKQSIDTINAAIDAAEANPTPAQTDSKAQRLLEAQAQATNLEEETFIASPSDEAAAAEIKEQLQAPQNKPTPISVTVEEANGKVQTFEITEDQTDSSSGDIANSIIAIVEDRPITLYEVFEQMAPIIPQIQKESRNQEEFTLKMKMLERQALDNIIDGVLIVRYFESKKFQIPENVLDNEINEFLQTRYNGDKGLLIKDLQRIGKSFKKFKDEMKDRIIIQAMQERMLKTKSHISPEKIRVYYLAHLSEFEQEPSVEISQITLKGSSEERANHAKTIETALQTGRPFAEIAKQYSQDQKATAGGYWGWIPKSSLRSELADPIFQLDAHQYSKPIVVGDRTYIVFVNDKKLGGARPIEEVQGFIEDKVSRELSRESYNEWLQHLRSRAYIRYTQDQKQPH